MRKNPQRVVLSTLSALAVTVTGLAALPAAADDEIPVDNTRKTYIVQLNDEPIIAYEGGTAGIPATAPDEGEKVNVRTSSAKKYADHLKKEHRETLADAGVSTARAEHDFTVSFNGFTADLTEAEVAKVKKVKKVANVWEDETRYADTVSTPDYLGLTGRYGVWQQQFGKLPKPWLGKRGNSGIRKAGKGVVIGVIDTGIDPHNPSFAAMKKRDVDPDFKGVCDAGADPDFKCNNKVIGARYFGEDFGNPLTSVEIAAPTDRGGHGSHTAGTAAGNYGVPMTIGGYDMGKGSGMAPAAQLSVYKALWEQEDGKGSGSSAGLVAAIDAAVADGVDIINYSVSGSSEYVVTPDEIAFLYAANAGVFIAASAGNSGDTVGASSVAHNAPWTMTVAASTHDRAPQVKTLTLGNGNTYQGAGIGEGVGPADLIYAGDAGLEGVDETKVKQCHPDVDADGTNGIQPALDPEKIAGKIVLCDRGAIARVDKSLAVKNGGGIGMVHANVSAGSTNADVHSVPSIHIDDAAGAKVRAYAQAGGATATISESSAGEKPVSPKMADFSSYGPALAGGGDLLKPDITAPGVDIIAPVAADRETGEARWDSYQGTSMSAPHIAGLAALIKQKHKKWSPMMIKSAMMTTALPVNSEGRPITLFDGTTKATPLNYGSGEVKPSEMFDPGLVYNSKAKDWLAYGCALDQIQLTDLAKTCDFVKKIDPSDLNYPSIAVGDLAGSQTIKRKVKNVSGKTEIYRASIQAPPGFKASVSPRWLVMRKGQTKSFKVTITRTTAPLNQYAFGELTWWGSRGHAVMSPIAVRPVAIAAPKSLESLTGAAGSAEIKVTPGFTGTLNSKVDGLQPSTVKELADLAADPSTTIDALEFIEVGEGVSALKVATFDADTDHADLDLAMYHFDTAGNLVGKVADSATGTSEESMTLLNPAPGRYAVAIDVYSGEKTGTARLHSWVLNGTDEGNMSVAPSPVQVTLGKQTKLTATYSGLDEGQRYFGLINYYDGKELAGTTTVAVKS